jgi:hypothetical protein
MVHDNPAIRGFHMSELAKKHTEPGPAEALEAEVEEAIAVCGGDVRAALRTTLIANTFLESEIDRLKAQVSTGFARGRVCKRAAKEDGEKKTN